ncbi:hypothetical protein ACIGXA_10560 [Streptomyces fildesensis]|uniref:Uncharacterized protein n=1 Tax=Streptomyces fildesensis TaxID=375757 RepID=A0ABW8C3E5_9ACTN
MVINSPTARSPVAQPPVTVTVTPTEAPPTSAGPSPSTAAATVTKNDIRMPDRFNLLLSDDPIKLYEGYGGDLSYYSSSGLASKQGKLVRLEAGHAGSRQECEADTRFTDTVENAKLIKGSKICILSSDHVGLVTIRAAPETRDGSHFVTFDIIVWP